jgi:ubiquinone/menaquinone biosynthesis C-methylase UbiE
MTNEARDATSIWDARYEGGEHVGSQLNLDNDPIDYTQHKFLYRHAIAVPTTGSEDGWVVDDVCGQHLKIPAERVLSIGCGMAFIEEHIVKAGYARHITAFEMSAAAIEAAKARVAGETYADRLDLRAGDVLEERLADASFDVVYVQAAIHHFFKIEEMFQLMHRVLKPGGLLMFDEYIGPDHHIYDDHVLAILDRIDECLAPHYRWDSLVHHQRQGVPKPSLDFMMQHDPSEGVHASQILPLTYQYFDVIDRRDYGGSVTRPFFTGILRNFDWQDAKDQTIGRLIVLLERLLVEAGTIPNYQTFLVGRRRPEPLAPLTADEAARINYANWQAPMRVIAALSSQPASRPRWKAALARILKL